MHVLLLGASGFIGRHVAARLLTAGHRVTGAARDTSSLGRRFPGIATRRLDLNRMTNQADWMPLLDGVDAVVNCAGILQQRRGQSIASVHRDAPIALFSACSGAGVRRVVQISAVSADDAAGTAYAATKKAADDFLSSLDLDWVVLRPSLVYGRGSYGGTSFLRGLAGLPWFTPLLGAGRQRFTPIHVDDLAATVLIAVEGRISKRSLDPCGPQTMTLAQLVADTRAWLDLPPARPLPVPMAVARAAARLGDLVPLGPVNSTALRQLEHGNAADSRAFAAAVDFIPRSLTEAFLRDPSHVQDRWHARLYFIQPLLTVVLFLVWLVSGLTGLAAPGEIAAEVVSGLGLPLAAAPFLAVAACALDIAIALSVLAAPRRWTWASALAQAAVVIGYTVALSIAAPQLWSDPFGPLLKNLAVLALIGAWAALRDER